jgi:transcription elongation factor
VIDKADGSITAWGDSDWGGTGAPSGSGYTKIHSTLEAFAAIKDGTITAWGESSNGAPHAAIDPSALRAAKACPVE